MVLVLDELAVLFKEVVQNNLIFCLLLGDFATVSSFIEECINMVETPLCDKFIYGSIIGETKIVTWLVYIMQADVM